MTEAAASGIGVTTHNLTMRFGNLTALDDLDLTIRPGVITGLIGRNGAGKSTLLSLIAGLREPTFGTVMVDGEAPFENPLAMADTQLVREGGDAFDSDKVKDTFSWYADMREGWDQPFANDLIARFGLNIDQKVEDVSRGQRSMIGAIIGLAARAPLTIFDETYLGMDAVNRQMFYDALMADYLEHPRTIVISSHLISEVERMFEDVVMIDDGRLLLSGTADDIRATGVTLTGPRDAVGALIAGDVVVRRTELGPTLQVTLRRSEPDPGLKERARAVGVEVSGTTLQDLFVDLVRKDNS